LREASYKSDNPICANYVYLLRFIRSVVLLRLLLSSSSSSSLLELELELLDEREVVDGRVRELDDEVLLTLCDFFCVGVGFDVVTDVLRCFVRSLLLLLRKVELDLDEELVRLEEDIDLLKY
jgi:hypothetical protein